jgi:N-methylhydantoinase A
MPLDAPHKENGRFRIGIDVGGTFTDFVVNDGASARLINFKEPSTPEDPSIAVERGLSTIMCDNNIHADEIALIVHGTTISLNAIIQRKGAPLAFVVSCGNRDVLEIGRSRMSSPYDMFADKEEPLVPRNLVFECSARAKADGSVISFPGDPELDGLAERLRAAEVGSVAINLLNAYVNPEIECNLIASLRSRLPGILLTASSEIWPEVREYERALVTTLNAYVRPLMDAYLTRLRERLDGLGIGAHLYVTASNGGCLSIGTARQRPVDTILSGPASGVVAAAHLAHEAGWEEIITVDMGGTSSDMSICQMAEPETTTLTYVGDFPLVTPVVNVSAIGAGGGSIVWVDNEGLLKVGPESAGADPGPVCYGRGGSQPTVTDCYLALGILQADRFLDGRMRLDRDAACATLDAIGKKIGLPIKNRAQHVATAALRVATAKMAAELSKGLAKRGADPRDFTLLPYGGAGPVQANLLAEEAHLDAILIPLAPGLFCALGALVSDVKRDFVRSLRAPLDSGMSRDFMQLMIELQAEALSWLEGEGDIIEDRVIARSADVRYVGQAYELNVLLSAPVCVTGDIAAVATSFHQAHKRVHGFADPDAPIELYNLRVTATGKVPKPRLPEPATSPGSDELETRSVWLGDAWRNVTVFWREKLAPGAVIDGPALVEQPDTTVVLLPDWCARVDRTGALFIERSSQHEA